MYIYKCIIRTIGNIPKHKIPSYQTNKFQSYLVFSRYTKILIFGMKIYHLATLTKADRNKFEFLKLRNRGKKLNWTSSFSIDSQRSIIAGNKPRTPWMSRTFFSSLFCIPEQWHANFCLTLPKKEQCRRSWTVWPDCWKFRHLGKMF
jgi:hypothetical protein